MFYLLRFLYLYVWIHRVCLSIFCCLLSSNIFLIYHNYFCVQAVSVMGRGEPVYSASPVAGLYDARTLQLAGPAPAYSQHAPAPASPQLSTTYSHAPAPAPVYSQSLAQAHEMSLGAHNVYHLVRPDHLQNIPSGDYLNMFKYFYQVLNIISPLQRRPPAGPTSPYQRYSSPGSSPPRGLSKNLWTTFLEQF